MNSLEDNEQAKRTAAIGSVAEASNGAGALGDSKDITEGRSLLRFWPCHVKCSTSL